MFLVLVHGQKISILLLQKALEIPEGLRGSPRPTSLKNCIKFNWNFQSGGRGGGGRGGLMKNLSRRRGMDIFIELHSARLTYSVSLILKDMLILKNLPKHPLSYTDLAYLYGQRYLLSLLFFVCLFVCFL